MEPASETQTARRKPVKKWHEFEPISAELAMLRGLSSTHSPRFKPASRGLQASAACCAAAALAHLLEPADWRPALLELALDCGDRLFRASKASQQPASAPRALACAQLQPEFYLGGYRCRLCVEPALRGRGPCELQRALAELLLGPEPGYGALSDARGRCAAVWSRPAAGPALFHFEPGPCDERGRRAAAGAACLARCADLRVLCARLAALGPGAAGFRLERLRLVRLQPVGRGPWRGREAGLLRLDARQLRAFGGPARGARATSGSGGAAERRPAAGPEAAAAGAGPAGACCGRPLAERRLDPEGAGFPQLSANVPPSLGPLGREPAMAVLHGRSHEADATYRAGGRQSAANCVVALAMRKAQPVRTWLRESLDRVLAAGDELYARVRAAQPGVESVSAADMHHAQLQIDARKMFVSVDLLTVVGTIVSRTGAVANLKQGLQEFFLDSSEGVLECFSLTVALWKEDDYYYLFDSRACDVNGVRVVASQSGGSGKGSASSPTEKKPVGKCCVIRFAKLTLLDTHLRKNLDPTETNDRFVIRRVTVTDDIPGTRPWNSFEAAAAGKSWMLKGTIGGDSDIFSDHSRGIQGLAIAVVCLISAKTIQPSNWFKEDVDDAVRVGDSYYNWCIPYGGESDGDEEKSLNIKRLKKYLYYKKCKAIINVKESCVMGNLQTENDSDAKSLENGVLDFFKQQQYGIVEANGQFFAIWKFEEELKDNSIEMAYYLMHDNPSQAFLSKILSKPGKIELSACVFRFVEVTELVAVLTELLQVQSEEDQLDYFIHEVEVVSISEPMTDEEIQKDKAIPVRPDLRNYAAFGDYGATLAGNFNQNDEAIFKRETRGKQQAASALVTLAMTKIFYPYLWYREVVDDILKMGDKLTHENLKNLPEADNEDEENARYYLLPSEIGNDFALGVNQMSLSVEEETFSGKLDELNATLQEFFAANKMGIFRQDKIILPIWREEAAFFTMDPVGKQAASVYWFINIQSLVDILEESTEKTDANFFIDTVTVENKFIESELPEENLVTEDRWYNFSKIADGIWQINCKMNDETNVEDDVAELNCSTANSVMAIVFSKAYEARFWSQQLLDEITAAGRSLHAQSVIRLGEDRFLRPNEVIDEFFVSDRRIELDVQDCVQAGKINGQGSKIQSLQSGCVAFFEKFSSGCLSLLAARTQAIWAIEDHFYSFEPGRSLMRFESLALLVEQLEANADGNSDFEITSIEVVDWNKLPPWHFDPSPAVRPSDLPPLNAYSRLPGKARAILRASIHQESDVFPKEVRGCQSAANCITALAMSQIKNPVTWTRKTLDEILAFGLNLHLESAKSLGARSSRLKPQDIARIFQMGPNVLAVDVESDTVTGTVEQPPAELDGDSGKTAAQRKGPGQAKNNKTDKKAKKKGVESKKRARPEPPSAPTLADGLNEFFEKHSAGVLAVGRFTVAIWRASGVYFVFDPRPRNNQGRGGEPGDAASCVCWFACRQPFGQLLADNATQDGYRGAFRICSALARRLAVEPLPALPSAGPGFERLDARLSTLVAGSGWHMAAARFPPETRGLQSSAVACAALVLARLRALPGWPAALLRAALTLGDRLHAECARPRRHLAPAELPRLLALGELRARLRLEEGLAAGLSLEADLCRALGLFFEAGRDAGLLHTAGLSLAVAHHSGRFFLLDPSDDNARGCACLLRCDSLAALAQAAAAVGVFRGPAPFVLSALHVDELRFFEL
ncbi:uncharacterized protein LOC131675113 [Phymastichus coffea]|uniref:uncharacterized protein LOC131675113 n=1 Tax=Phymastichus coffea TaxID=108790 RepID=UPI00273B318F|nr:uncharacterized protein LOC131675113 [Phymastichus coffea]